MAIHFSIPKSWNELSDRQFKQLSKLFLSGQRGLIFDLKCLRVLLNIRWYQLGKRLRLVYVLSQIPLKELKKEYEFIYTDIDRTIFLEKINGFYAPLNKITNLTVEEFSVADDLHIKWRETGNKEYLIYLAAVLYSETKQPRTYFDKNNLPDKIKHFQKVPIEELHCAELTYLGCKTNLVKRFPTAFPKGTKKVSNSKYGFGKVILQMAGGKFGNHEQTKATNIYTFLEEFNENLKNVKDVKKNT
jgi:hypothetical protein